MSMHPADRAMVPDTHKVFNPLREADPLTGQLTFGDVAVLIFALAASLFAMIVTLAT